ncbi:hypothetical protein ROS1_28500 [Roseibium sp. ROS1]
MSGDGGIRLNKALLEAAMRRTVEVAEEKTSQDAQDKDEITAAKEAVAVHASMLDNEDKGSNIRLRKKYASRVYWYLVVYSLIVALMVIASGFSWKGFSLPETVLGLLVGSTAVSAIGLVHAVVTGLFRQVR